MDDALLFWILAAGAVTASVLVIGQRNPMRSVLLLIVSFIALSDDQQRSQHRDSREEPEHQRPHHHPFTMTM